MYSIVGFMKIDKVLNPNKMAIADFNIGIALKLKFPVFLPHPWYNSIEVSKILLFPTKEIQVKY